MKLEFFFFYSVSVCLCVCVSLFLKKHLNLVTQGYYIQTLDDSGRIWELYGFEDLEEKDDSLT